MKSVLFFLYVVLFSTTIHAKVEVLCLGEGECVTVERNTVHPGALSGASETEQTEYEVWNEVQKIKEECKAEVLSHDSCDGYGLAVDTLDKNAKILSDNSTF